MLEKTFSRIQDDAQRTTWLLILRHSCSVHRVIYILIMFSIANICLFLMYVMCIFNVFLNQRYYANHFHN